MFALRLSRAEHVRDYSIVQLTPSGWEVRCQEDQTLCRLDRYDDWHRVERALQTFQREADELAKNGWQVQSQSS